jgi:mono/diheme cytochrome c family protein
MNRTQRTSLSLTGRGPLGVWLLLLALAALPAALGGTTAAAEEESEAFKAAKGKVTYRIYCSNCHGAEAEGDGKLAPLLTVKPADLTELVKKKDKGEFPAERVRAAIDGRAEVAGHGYREMPVWGDAFRPTDPEMADPDKVKAAEAKIAELVAYLKTIQEEGG